MGRSWGVRVRRRGDRSCWSGGRYPSSHVHLLLRKFFEVVRVIVELEHVLEVPIKLVRGEVIVSHPLAGGGETIGTVK